MLDTEAGQLVAEVGQHVTAKVTYIDTLSIWLPIEVTPGEPLNAEQLRDELVDTGLVSSKTRLDKIRKKTWVPPGYQRRITLQFPTDAALEYLEGRLQGLYLVSRLDVALDLCTRSKFDAQAVWDFMDAHLILPYHRNKHRAVVSTDRGRTKYYNGKRGRNNLVVYDGKPSKKITGSRCCHVERRARTPAAVRQILGGPAHHVTLTEILAIDLRLFWSERLCLGYPDLDAVAMRLNGRSRGKIACGKDRLRAHWTGRVMGGTDQYDYNMQELLDTLKGRSRELVWHRIDNQVFLPPEPAPPLININIPPTRITMP